MLFWKKSKKQKVEPTEAAEESKESATKMPETLTTVEKRGGASIFGILERPRITEKSRASSEEGKYVFIVSSRANKIAIKRAVEARYGVGVASVKVLNMPGKERRRGRQIGWKPGYKKAIVTLKEGEDIEIQ